MVNLNFTISDPTSQNDVTNCYGTATERLAGPIVGAIPFQQNTVMLIGSYSHLAEYQAHELSMSQQAAATKDFNVHKDIVENLVKCQVDELNHNIKLSALPFNSGYSESNRLLYGLTISQTTYPKLITYKDVRKWAENMINGEKARIANGGQPLKGITWEVLETWYLLMVQKHQVQVEAFATSRATQKALTVKIRYFIRKVYPEMKADVQYFFRTFTKEAFREAAESWGILFRQYGEDTNLYGFVDGYVLNDDIPIEGVSVEVVGQELILHTDAAGYFSSHQVLLGFCKLKVVKFPFAEKLLENVEVKADNTQPIIIKLEYPL